MGNILREIREDRFIATPFYLFVLGLCLEAKAIKAENNCPQSNHSKAITANTFPQYCFNVCFLWMKYYGM